MFGRVDRGPAVTFGKDNFLAPAALLESHREYQNRRPIGLVVDGATSRHCSILPLHLVPAPQLPQRRIPLSSAGVWERFSLPQARWFCLRFSFILRKTENHVKIETAELVDVSICCVTLTRETRCCSSSSISLAKSSSERDSRSIMWAEASILQIRRIVRGALVVWHEQGLLDNVPLPKTEKMFPEPHKNGKATAEAKADTTEAQPEATANIKEKVQE